MSKIRRTFVFHPVRDQNVLAALDALNDGKNSLSACQQKFFILVAVP